MRLRGVELKNYAEFLFLFLFLFIIFFFLVKWKLMEQEILENEKKGLFLFLKTRPFSSLFS